MLHASQLIRRALPMPTLLCKLYLLLFATFTFCAHSTNAAKKNILFIIVDDLRPALGCYDDSLAITPNIDRLAQKSVLFQRAYAQQALCAPSRNSMLTSRRPDTLHLYDFYSYWRRAAGNFTTIPQYFKEHGYQTYSIGKVFHPGISSNFNDDFPFSWSNETFHASTERFMNDAVCLDKITHKTQENLVCPVDVETQPEQSLPDIQSIAEAKRLLQTLDKNKPFFIAIGLHKPHIPFRFPIEYLRYHNVNKFRKNDFTHIPYNLPTVAFNPFNDIRRRDDVQRLNMSFPFGPMQASFAWQIRQAYYSCVTYIDEYIGKLLTHVDFSNTIIVLTSDHGYSLGEHAEWAKYTNFEIGVRIPLIVYSPDYQFNDAHKINEFAELVDIFPTLVDLAALPKVRSCTKTRFEINTCTEGKSLFHHFGSTLLNDSSSVAISQYPRPGADPTVWPDSDRPRLKNIKIMGYSLRTHRFRYTIWLEFNPKLFRKNWLRNFGEELYDHSIDPNEMINLIGRSELEPLRENLKRMLREKLDDPI